MTTTTDHAKRVQAARTKLVLDQPFFGVLALRLNIVADSSCKTAWVDGRTLGYNPAFVGTLSQRELEALICHEVMHCAMGHPWRRDGREKGRWNAACDYAINPVLRDADFTLPAGALLDPAHDGKCAEWIFDRIPEPQQDEDEQGQDGDGQQGDDQGESGPSGSQDDDSDVDGDQGSQSGQDDDSDADGGEEGQDDDQGDPSDQDDGEPGEDDQDGDTGQDEDHGNEQGEVRDAPAEADEEGVSEGEWQQAVQQAAQAAKSKGQLPGALDRFAETVAKPRVDWRSVLRRFVQQIARTDYTWTRPNARYVVHDLYMPALHQDELGPIVVAVDTSGSIDAVLLAQFAAEIQAVTDEAQPLRVHVMYCDARLQRTDTFERGDAIEMRPMGGGGTEFAPVFDALDQLEETPAAVVYLTDLAGGFPSYIPEVPTLWACPNPIRVPPPFGEVVEIAA